MLQGAFLNPRVSTEVNSENCNRLTISACFTLKILQVLLESRSMYLAANQGKERGIDLPYTKCISSILFSSTNGIVECSCAKDKKLLINMRGPSLIVYNVPTVSIKHFQGLDLDMCYANN